MAEPRIFRFKPRYRGIAISALGIGGVLGAASLAVLGAAILPLATGAAGVVLGAAYLMSPSWKLEVVIDDDAIADAVRELLTSAKILAETGGAAATAAVLTRAVPLRAGERVAAIVSGGNIDAGRLAGLLG